MKVEDRAAQLDELFSRLLKPEERQRLELLLLQRIRDCKEQLATMLETMSGHWTYEDYFYRYYHGSFKIYSVQDTTEAAVKLLRSLMPERKLNSFFEGIIAGGTGKKFDLSHNDEWDKHTLPMLEAFSHTKFMVEMAVRYSNLTEPPSPLPSGYAALLYLYDLR